MTNEAICWVERLAGKCPEICRTACYVAKNMDSKIQMVKNLYIESSHSKCQCVTNPVCKKCIMSRLQCNALKRGNVELQTGSRSFGLPASLRSHY